jgi:hypothetical protein
MNIALVEVFFYYYMWVFEEVNSLQVNDFIDIAIYITNSYS